MSDGFGSNREARPASAVARGEVVAMQVGAPRYTSSPGSSVTKGSLTGALGNQGSYRLSAVTGGLGGGTGMKAIFLVLPDGGLQGA